MPDATPRDEFDAIVVGAGPAGSAAALELARAGRRVALVERGPHPGSKNLYGGVVYGRVLDEAIPRWWEEVPAERWVVRRSTALIDGDRSLSIDFRAPSWGEAPYNGMTTLRSRFDAWLAAHATAAGAVLVPSTVVTGLVRDGRGRVRGVVTDRDGAELSAPLVIACDGVHSFLARSLGLHVRADAHHHTLGVKEVRRLDPELIDQRFGVARHEGVDIEMLGVTRGIAGGGFLYTNADTVSVGVVVALDQLASAKVRPEELVADLVAHPSIAPLLAGSTVVEYGAHLIPEGGYRTMPELCADGFLVAGDAAAMTLAAGIWLEGVNFAIGSGLAAGRAGAAAIAAGDTSAKGLAGYRRALEEGFVLRDHRRFRDAPGLVLSPRVQRDYPGLVCDLTEALFTVTNPAPKPGALSITRRLAKRRGVSLPKLAVDAIRAARIFG